MTSSRLCLLGMVVNQRYKSAVGCNSILKEIRRLVLARPLLNLRKVAARMHRFERTFRAMMIFFPNERVDRPIGGAHQRLTYCLDAVVDVVDVSMPSRGYISFG